MEIFLKQSFFFTAICIVYNQPRNCFGYESDPVDITSQVNLEDFALVGTELSRKDRDAHMFDGKHYFRSKKQVSYKDGLMLCLQAGPNAHILYVEEQGENVNLKAFLRRSDALHETYWIGGKFEKGKWLWENGVPLNPDVFEWETNAFGLYTESSRLAVWNNGDLKVKPMPTETKYRVICEYSAVNGAHSSDKKRSHGTFVGSGKTIGTVSDSSNRGVILSKGTRIRIDSAKENSED